MTFRAELSAPPGSVRPGETFTAALTVRNEGRDVDVYTLTMLGLPEQWTQKELGQLAVPPGNGERIRIPVPVPRGSELKPGRLVFAVKVVSAASGHVAIPEAQIEVEAFRDLHIETDRPRVSGRFFASNLITFRNTGNTDVDLRLCAAPEDGKAPLTARLGCSELVLRPGQKARVRVLLRVVGRTTAAACGSWNIDIAAQAAEGTAGTAAFLFTRRPALMTAAACKTALALLLAALAGVAVWLSPLGGNP
ncbi:hypothetical protein ACFP1Z_31380 [Streptomyces gamaensis]|uniref:Alpha-galactosidase NEW3 domain-containing protein n=1 Tax=Streptomyces gamaensis TaxID=1763542 RepID=A0ABW0Z776_9ACTN